jgi:conjugative transfer signal peptidase TraF
MMRRQRAAICAVVGAVLGVFAVARAAGLRVNATPSMPVGLWMVTAASLSLGRGEIVAVCLPDTGPAREAFHRGYIAAGSCPSGTEPLVKPIAAISGDVVAVSAAGIAVNNTPIANTAPLGRDDAGRPLEPVPAGLYRVPPGQLWLLSGHDPRSFDSRYFGAVPIAGVRGTARPIWILQ